MAKARQRTADERRLRGWIRELGFSIREEWTAQRQRDFYSKCMESDTYARLTEHNKGVLHGAFASIRQTSEAVTVDGYESATRPWRPILGAGNYHEDAALEADVRSFRAQLVRRWPSGKVYA